jgi:serine/threonine protein kinase
VPIDRGESNGSRTARARARPGMPRITRGGFGRAEIVDAPAATSEAMTEPPSAGTGARSDNALPVGSQIGEFTILGLIGEGGFGIVYLAHDDSLGRDVALKEYMPSELAQRAADGRVIARSDRHVELFELGRQSFINEGKLLARFDHPSLLKVYRSFEANGTAYMAMPYYMGATLTQVVAVHGPPNEAQLKAVLDRLLEALEVMHRAECVHRDVSPENVLILTDHRPLLLDFGAARRVIRDRTQPLTAILRPDYAPIEQYAKTTLKQGPWTDLYALAGVAHFIITGSPPPQAPARALHDEYVPLETVAAGRYSAEFLRAIDRALAVRPQDRPQSAREFKRLLDLSEVTQFPPILRPGPDPNPHPRAIVEDPPRDRRVIIAAAALLVAVLGAILAFVMLDNAPTPTAPAPGKEAKRDDLPSPAAIRAKLDSFDCARLKSAVNGRAVVVEGFVPGEGDLQRITSEISTMPGVAEVDRGRVKVVPHPHCSIVGELAPFMSDGADVPTVGLHDGATRLFGGQKLVTASRAAGFAGYLYVDLYDTEGNVVHMLPNSTDRGKVEPDARRILGDHPMFGKQWELVPPFGVHMLVVMHSEQPLFASGARPEVEKASAYLAAVTEYAGTMRPGEKLVASYSLFEVAPGR